MGEARGYKELRGETCGDLGRDRTREALSIQIICPSSPLDATPRVVFDGDDTGEGQWEDIGLLQRPI
jgi:hypothetical protein